MADFETELLAAVGDDGDAFDIRAAIRRVWFFDFDGYPLRLWHGQGKLITSDGSTWIGTVDPAGTNHLQAPSVRDEREGTSQQYSFTIPHVDQATYDALKTDAGLTKGRSVTCYHAIFGVDEGLRPSVPIRYSYKLQMQGVSFSQALAFNGGSTARTYSATVLCRPLGYGRSKYPGGTYTDTSQRARADLLGVSSDSGCVFVAGNARRTYSFD